MGLVAYITAGDPSLDATEKFVLALAEAGADVIELGVPFSDPVADGPVIQRASERALRSGTTLAGVTRSREVAARENGSAAGAVQLFQSRAADGTREVCGMRRQQRGPMACLQRILRPEEAGEYRAAMLAHGLDTIFLAAPTSTDERLALIAEMSSGFLYLISRTGVTGASAPGGLAGAGATRAARDRASDRHRLRNFAAGPRFRAGRIGRCRRRRLGAGRRNRTGRQPRGCRNRRR